MLTTLIAGGLAVLTLAQQTDTIIPARGATRLDLENRGGQVIVHTWDRDDIQIRAEHSSRTMVEIDRLGNVIEIEAEARRGPATIVDYELTVPRALDLNIEGMFTTVTIEDADGAVEVETLEGDINIRGGRGSVIAESTNGEVTVEGAQGRVEVSSVSRGVRVSDSSGEILAETVSGPVILQGIAATSVEAGTVSGRVEYEGTIEDGGRYVFGTHAGRIVLTLPAGVNATVALASLTGGIGADYPGAPTEFERRERTTFTLGTGSARIEAETFSGGITIRRAGGG